MEEKLRCQKIADQEMNQWLDKMNLHLSSLEPERRKSIEEQYRIQRLMLKRDAREKKKIDETAPKAAWEDVRQLEARILFIYEH